MITGPVAKQRFRDAILKAISEAVRKRKGKLEAAAEEIGVSRQALQQYAEGSVPGGEVLLTAFVQWGLVVRIEDPDASPGEPRWWECGLARKDKASMQKPPEPVQLPLFQAIDDLEDQHVDVKILRKSSAKIELGVDIAFPKRLL